MNPADSRARHAGYTRIMLPELCIVESKPDNTLHDLRIPAPFAELAALRETVDVDAEVTHWCSRLCNLVVTSQMCYRIRLSIRTYRGYSSCSKRLKNGKQIQHTPSFLLAVVVRGLLHSNRNANSRRGSPLRIEEWRRISRRPAAKHITLLLTQVYPKK